LLDHSELAVKRKFAFTVINVYLENLSYLRKQNFNMYIKIINSDVTLRPKKMNFSSKDWINVLDCNCTSLKLISCVYIYNKLYILQKLHLINTCN